MSEYTDVAWEKANCAGVMNTPYYPGREEIFHPTDKKISPIAKKALRYCNVINGGCPIKADCLNYALSAGERGIWGGTLESERAESLRRSRRRAYVAKAAAKLETVA